MESRIILQPSAMTAIQAGAPPATPEAATGVLNAGVVTFQSSKWSNLHIHLQNTAGGYAVAVNVTVLLFGYTGPGQPPTLIDTLTPNESQKCDVSITDALGYQFLYLRQTVGAAASYQLAYEGKWSV